MIQTPIYLTAFIICFSKREMDEKEKAKQILLEKLKGIKIKSENSNKLPINVKNQPNEYPIPLQRPSTVLNPAAAQAKRIEEDDELNQRIQGVFEEPFKKEEEKPKDYQRKVLKTRRPYYEHYSKEGVYKPALEYIQNHPNPSGKPSDIPQHLLKGIQVVPKRPWVFFGPENIPPTECQDINEKNFALIFQKARKEKKQNSGILKKSVSKKKNKVKHDDDISEISDEFTSNFTFTDSVDLSKESDLISEFRSQTRTNKNNYESSQMEDQSMMESSVAGSVTQKQKYNLFDSSDSDKQSVSVAASQRKVQKKKVMFDSSDSQGEKKSVLKSEADSSMGVSQQDDVESSVKVDIDDDSGYTSRRNSNRPRRPEKKKKEAPKKFTSSKSRPSKGSKSKKMKAESSQDSDDSS